MKLYLRDHDYRYAVEQMLLTLFPLERPEYPDGPPAQGEDHLITALDPQGSAVAELCWGGVTHHGAFPVPPHQSEDGLARDRACQHAVKQAFFQAAVSATGQTPPWGALTGVRPVKLPTRRLLAGGTEEEARRELEKGYHVSPQRAALALDCARESVALLGELEERDLSVYLGIPFCPTRCAYCSFVSADVQRTLRLVEPYLDLLIRETERAGQTLDRTGRRVKTFYMGGGTPTTLSPGQMDRLLTAVERHLPLEGCVESTVEAGRPDTITREKLQVLRDHKIGRISINPQTMDDRVLAAMGRAHRSTQVLSAMDEARSVGGFQVNMDLIAGLPLDDEAGFARSLETVLALAPENITVHTLALKKGSTLMERGDQLPDAPTVGAMLEHAWHTLRQAGYAPYYLYRQKYMSGGFENVSWCRPGTVNRYNIIMMEELHTVLSLGAGGVTKVVDRRTGAIRRLSNPKYPHDYLAQPEKLLAQKDAPLDFRN